MRKSLSKAESGRAMVLIAHASKLWSAANVASDCGRLEKASALRRQAGQLDCQARTIYGTQHANFCACATC
jgi:hypothetical protein